jgi:hypothetical protein
MDCVTPEFPEDRLESLKEALHADGFICYETTIGGSGLGVAVRESKATVAESQAHDDVLAVPSRKRLTNATPSELHAWAEEVGPWAYV